MPSTRIETRSGWLEGRQLQLIEAVQRALVQSIKIPPEDRDIRLVEYDDSRMLIPENKSNSYVSIEVSMFPGRSERAKRALFAAITRETAQFGLRPSDTTVILHEISRDNWGMGGVPASDIALGYDTNV